MKRRVSFTLTILALAGLILAPNASAQDSNIQDVLDKLSRLERDVQTLNRQVYKGSPPPKSSASNKSATGRVSSSGAGPYIARIESRLDQLEEEIRTTTGNIENITHTLNQISTRLDKLVSDIDFRLSNLEARVGNSQGGVQQGQVGQPLGQPKMTAAPRAAGVQRVGPQSGGPVLSSGKPQILGSVSETDLSKIQSGNIQSKASDAKAAEPAKAKSILPEGTPQEQYRYAYSFLRKNDYDNAEIALKEVIEKYNDQPVGTSAIYWLGRTYYVKGDYRTAADTFLRGYQKNPNSQKAPDILLRLGMSLNGMKKVKEACATFAKLAKDYPGASASTKKLLKVEKGRTGCK